MNKYISSEQWMPAANLSFEPESLRIIKSNRNVLVSAGPGAGKTELLAQRASFLLQTNTCVFPRKILALSYKVDAAGNLTDRVVERCGNLLAVRFDSRTYDAFAKSILDQFRNLLPDEYQPSQYYDIANQTDIKNALNKAGYWQEANNKFYFSGRYFTEYKLPAVDTPYGDIARRVWPILLKGSDMLEPKLTFSMISRLAEMIVRLNPMIRKSIQMSYQYVFLDEFQDTPAHHFDLIKTCFGGSGCIITAVGDKKQRVMGWAGALENVFEKFSIEFNALTETLLVNHRSAPRLVELQKPIVKYLTEEEIPINCSTRWEVDEGVAEVWRFKNEDDEALMTAKKILSLMAIDGVQARDICILARVRPSEYSSALIRELKRHGLEARLEEPYQDLLKEDLITLLKSVLLLAAGDSFPDEWIFSVNLLKSIKGYNLRSANQLQLHQNVEESFNSFLSSFRNKMKTVQNKEEFMKRLETILDYFDRDLLHGQYRQYNNAYISYLTQKFGDLIWKEYELCNDWVLSIERFNGEGSIPIMSIHKSKGLEFNTVFVLGVEDQAFFGYENNPSEELCTFFVSVSRAIERLYLTCCKIRDNHIVSINTIELFYKLLKNSGTCDFFAFDENFEEKFEWYFK
ncbi:ATP-dependent helicase [Paenibacillus sp. FSL K6-2441]|uniref:ATP-dependent helicase n=1 Tax=Paenibacillus TaxID=44249 RepID=UPI0030D845A7